MNLDESGVGIEKLAFIVKTSFLLLAKSSRRAKLDTKSA